MVLMEAPGPRTVCEGGSQFCSEDNADGTARAFAELRRQSGLARGDYLKWNIVPWAVHAADGHWAAPRESDLAAARPALAQLMGKLRRLRLVITMGQPACAGFMSYLTSGPISDPPVVLAVPHPSPRNARGKQQAAQRIRSALEYADELTL